ncbi:MAG: helix-turn-helix domain-containing protein [Candidatus Bathyarchaeota archaeon]|nr:helix-turn-helix domain-containing protein [Candidatus Bathyarchaeota archaeon]
MRVWSNHSSFKETGTQVLTDLGLTVTQAKLYLALLEIGESKAGALSQSIGLPRSEVYRTLSELQQKGLVEKEVRFPNLFIAIPLVIGLQSLLTSKVNQCTELKKSVKTFLQKGSSFSDNIQGLDEYKIRIIEGKERILKEKSRQNHNAQYSVRILSTLPSWLQIVECCIKDYEAALSRGVEYRVIIEHLESISKLPKQVRSLLEKPNFKLVSFEAPLKSNGTVFDENEALINFFPGKPLFESPLICTNHPSLISMLADQFEKTWNASLEYRLIPRNIATKNSQSAYHPAVDSISDKHSIP